jgi:hypothetical protein
MLDERLDAVRAFGNCSTGGAKARALSRLRRVLEDPEVGVA